MRVPNSYTNYTFVNAHFLFIDSGLEDQLEAKVTTQHLEPINYVTGYEELVNGTLQCSSIGMTSVSCPMGPLSLNCTGFGYIEYNCSTLKMVPSCSLLNTSGVVGGDLNTKDVHLPVHQN